MNQPGESILLNRDARHGIQPQNGEVRQVVCAQAFVSEMRMDAANASEPASSCPQASPVRKFDAAWSTDHDVLDVATPSHQHADLSPQVLAQASQFARKFGGHETVRGQSPAEETL